MARYKRIRKLEGNRSGKRFEPLKITDDVPCSGVVRSDSLDVERRSVGVSFSSEAPIEDFPGVPPISLLHEEGAVDLEGFRNVGSVLYDHDTKSVIGRPDNVRLDASDRVCRGDIVFDADSDSDKIFQKVKSGSIRGVSVRFKVLDGFMLREGERWQSPGGKHFNGPSAVVTKWIPREISLTPIPADASVGVGRSTTQHQGDETMPEWLKKIMVARGLVAEDASDEECRKVLEGLPENLKELLETTRSEGTQPTKKQEERKPEKKLETGSEGTRGDDGAASLRKTHLGLIELARSAGEAGRGEEWIEKGYTLDQARSELFDSMLSQRKPLDTRTRVEVGAEADRKFSEAITGVLARRCNSEYNVGMDVAFCEKWGQDMAPDMPLSQVVGMYAERSGIQGARNWSRERLATEGLRLVTGMRAMQHSTSDFPIILENLATKSLNAKFALAPTTFQLWGGVRSVRDFKTYSEVKLSESEEFVVNPELTPISESTVGEAKETYSVKTYARRFGISRQAIINDDLAGFSRIPGQFGDAAARTMNSVFYATWLANPTMTEDSEALFSASHTSGSNLGTGAVPSHTTLAEARKLMRLQKALNPKSPAYMNLRPKWILSPVALEETFLQLLQATFVPTAVTGVQPNWIQSTLTMIVEPLLDANSATAYYLAADAGTIDTIVAVYLNGVRTPQILRLDGTSILGVEWVAYFDFGAAALEHRGMVKNAGA